jgi:hypothetical protein
MMSFVHLLLVAMAPTAGVSVGPDFERYQQCIRSHHWEIRQPYWPRIGPFDADTRAINRHCGKLRPRAFRAYKKAFLKIEPRLTEREWRDRFENLSRAALYLPELR